jgi:hypothetical protein
LNKIEVVRTVSILFGHRRTILLAGFLILFCVWAASATCPGTKLVVKPSGVIIDNPGVLMPGMSVTVSVQVDFPATGGPTYPETSRLELTTALDNPQWTWNIVRDGVKKPKTEEKKSRVVISGDALSWPENVIESLEITLYGTAPSAPQMYNRTILKIQDITTTACTNTPVYQYNAIVLNTTSTRQKISDLEAELARFMADVDTKNRTGTDTSGVMKKIEEAQKNLETANVTPPLEYVSVAIAINNAETAIADGKHLLGERLAPDGSFPQYGPAPGQKTTTISAEEKGSQTTPYPTTVASSLPFPVFMVIIACTGAVMVRRRGA